MDTKNDSFEEEDGPRDNNDDSDNDYDNNYNMTGGESFHAQAYGMATECPSSLRISLCMY